MIIQQPLDYIFMKEALIQAQRAYNCNEVPIGAIVVRNSTIIGYGHNRVQELHSQNYHAEVIAINQAAHNIQDWRLTNCTIYVTVQPCLMCIGLIGLSRIPKLVYAANSPIFGYCLDKNTIPELYKKHIKEILSGILADEAQALLKKFFKLKRNLVSNIEAIKEKLLCRKQELEKELTQIYKDKISDDQVQDTGDQALVSTLEEVKISLHNNELEEYQMIIKALQMIDAGTYGTCIECGNPISEKRLSLFPNATRCLACQEALEEGHF